MKRCKLVIVLVILGVFSLSGCVVLNRVIYGPMPKFPQPYQSIIQFKTVREKKLNMKYLVRDTVNQRAMHSLGAVYHTTRCNESIPQAVESRGGDILLEARTQLVTRGLPLIYTEATIKVWGLVAKVK